MNRLTERQQKILAIIVNDYVETASPVGSKTISDRFHRDVSPATIRNDMARLEELGFITHPHTSAGRVPTDLGYRFFVDSLLPVQSIDTAEAGVIAWEYRQKVKGIEELIERTSRILSFLTEQASLVLYPTQKELMLKRIELIPYSHSHLLVIWATTTGIVQNKMVDMEELIPEEELFRLNRFLNAELSGKYFSEISGYLRDKLSSVKDSLLRQYRWAHEVASRAFQLEEEKRLYLAGSRFILKQPEFQEDAARTRTLFRILETKEMLRQAFDQDLTLGEVRVQIGSENRAREFDDYTLISTQYRCQNKPLGTLGILGPKRLPYARMISLVDFVARRLSDALDILI